MEKRKSPYSLLLAREEELMSKLDELEGLEDNPLIEYEIRTIRQELEQVREKMEDLDFQKLRSFLTERLMPRRSAR